MKTYFWSKMPSIIICVLPADLTARHKKRQAARVPMISGTELMFRLRGSACIKRYKHIPPS